MRKPWSRISARCSGILLAWACATAGAAAWAEQPQTCKPTTSETSNQTTEARLQIQSTEAQDTAYDKPVDGEPQPQPEPPRDPCAAPKTIAVQSSVTLAATTGFTGAIMSRLDSVRGEAAAGGSAATSMAALPSDGMMALGAKQRSRAAAAPSGPASPFTAYAMGTFQGGSSDAPELAGFRYGSTSGVAGIEYSVNRNLILGLAGGYTTTNADLTTGATIDADSVQVAAYLSYATKQWFVDALAAYGAVDLDLAREGNIRGSTDAGMLALAGRGGYLFDLGKVRAGPIAGITYVHGRVGGYTETGPDGLIVGAQTVDSVIGSAGVRFLAAFQAGGHLVVPYLNVTLEHQFGEATQILNLVQPGGAAGSLSFPAFDARDFGKVEGGLTVELAPEAAISLSGASTFARDEGHDFRVSAGLNYRF